VLYVPVSGITPAQLPTANLLDSMRSAGTLREQRFTPVGYGCVRDDPTGRPHSLDSDDNECRVADQEFHSLQSAWLLLNMNPSTGSGGMCFGDSGGPHFLATRPWSSRSRSRAIGGVDRRKTSRTDAASARTFLAQFVTLP
jgi:hypothetical protein